MDNPGPAQLLQTSQLAWQLLQGQPLPGRQAPSPGKTSEYRLARPAPHVITVNEIRTPAPRQADLALLCAHRHLSPLTARSVVYTPADTHSACCALRLAQAEHAGAPRTSCHATLIRLHGQGILIGGPPGSGKSTLALALIREAGASLVADDCVEVFGLSDGPAGRCPAVLSGYLHVPELGALDIARLFGQTQTVTACHINLRLNLTVPALKSPPVSLHGRWQQEILAGTSLPALSLDPGHGQLVSLVDTAARMLERTNRPQIMADNLQQRQQQVIRDKQA